MRRTIGVLAALALSLGVLGVMPAQATHCDASNASTCENPLTIIVIEGIGNVCSKAVLDDETLPKKCVYPGEHTEWVRTGSRWAQAGYEDGSRYQGLFWPGVGPAAKGAYSLRITGVAPPSSACVSNIGLAGCTSISEGNLLQGSSDLGAYCGSSSSDKGTVKFTSADRSLVSEGTILWDQSAATVLPLYGEINVINDQVQDPKPTLLGFVSARGLGGSGNCGITEPTTGFQVEGFILVF